MTMKPIQTLNFGFSDAENYLQRENKELFNRIFMKNSFLDKLLLSSTYFLIGEKGTGKTAYAVFLSNNKYRQTESILRYIRETDYQKFIKIKKQNQLDLSDYSNIWCAIILLLLSQHIVENEHDSSVFIRSNCIKQLIRCIDEYYQKAFAPEIINVLSFLEKSNIAAGVLSNAIKISGEKEYQTSFSESNFQINLLYIVNKFKEALKALKLKSNYTLYIDGIDIRPGNIEFEDYLECIKGLTDAVWSLNRDFFANIKDSKGRLKVVLLLRADIFNSVAMQNMTNKLQDNSVYLDWRTTYADYLQSDLFELGDRIFLAQQDNGCEIQKGACWDYYVPWSTETTNPECRTVDTSFINFLRISYSRPRDILTILKFFREIHQKICPDKNFFPRDIFSSMEFKNSYSNYLMGGIRDQLSFYYGNEQYEVFLKFFTFLSGREYFSYTDYQTIYSNYSKHVLSKSNIPPRFAENLDTFLQFLYDTNIICYQDERESKPYMRWCYRERSICNISPQVLLGASNYRIHTGLWKALNVGEH